MKLKRLAHNAKVPPKGDFGDSGVTDDPEIIRRWIAEGYNIGFPLNENKRVALDFDNKDAAREWYRKHKDICTVIVETRRGAHFYFSGHTKTRPFDDGDLIKSTGHMVYPPSTVDGWTYRLHEFGPLQQFPEHLFPPVPQEATAITRNVRDALRYVMAVESIENGSSNREASSRGLVRACAVLRDAGFSELDAMAVLVRWNMQTDKVCPPWEPEELARAISNTYRRVTRTA